MAVVGFGHGWFPPRPPRWVIQRRAQEIDRPLLAASACNSGGSLGIQPRAGWLWLRASGEEERGESIRNTMCMLGSYNMVAN